MTFSGWFTIFAFVVILTALAIPPLDVVGTTEPRQTLLASGTFLRHPGPQFDLCCSSIEFGGPESGR